MSSINSDFSMTIDGQPGRTAAFIEVVNPATEAVIARVPDIDEAGLDAAVAAARRAFPAWRDASLADRRAAVGMLAQILGQHADDLAHLFTLEQGRPLAKAKQEVLAAAFWCQSVSTQEIPVTVNEDTPQRRSETRHVPLGVVGAIVPWNFPMLLGVWKIAGALLTGNTLVVKPSPFTPLTMLKLGELMRPHLPAGVLNIVTGGDAVGPWMTAHPGIDKISFTGSTATGKRVMQSAAAGLKRVTLELGGNDPAIVLPDVDVKQAAAKIFWAAFNNSAQVCIAIKRLYVHADVYDALAAELVALARSTKMGDGMDPDSELGPMQNRAQFLRVKSMIEEARAAGLRFLAGGEVPNGTGYFVPVTLVDNPHEDAAVVQEEAFGPILPLLKFTDLEDVIARANATDYGLAASVWSGDLDKAAAIAARLEAGTVWVNEAQYVNPWTPFGGHKQSGIGVENGISGLLEYTNTRTISIAKAA